MNKHILALFALAAFAPACATNPGTPANNVVSNANSPITNSAAVVNTGNSAATNANAKNTATKTEKPAGSGQPERVSFAVGKNQTFLKRDIPANNSIEFVFNARSGQLMEYSVIYEKDPDIDIESFLTEPGSQDISASGGVNEPIEFKIKKTGDHRITVQNKTGNKVNIELGLVIK